MQWVRESMHVVIHDRLNAAELFLFDIVHHSMPSSYISKLLHLHSKAHVQLVLLLFKVYYNNSFYTMIKG